MQITQLGQVFTPPHIVDEMIALIKNTGTVLEPACGQGAFLSRLPQAVGVELDQALVREPLVCEPNVLWQDFFTYPLTEKFDTIIGNPPYVRFQDIRPATKQHLPMEWFDRRSNLYLFFIAKCMAHLRPQGELIFITPRDFLKATSAKTLNQQLYATGSITHFKELGDTKVFTGYSPNCAIWRWQKGRRDHRVRSGQGWFNYADGQLWFGPPARGSLGDHFSVKVGAVSGADPIFTHPTRGNAAMVYSQTATSGKTRQMIYNRVDPSLLPHKQTLLQRRIKAFDESNWWQWGRRYPASDAPRVYVNCKTRNPKPFFTHPSTAYDGAVMALFPHNPNTDVAQVAARLNQVDWSRLGFECDGRLLFTQRGLVNAAVDSESVVGD